jgi:hypothetical protein
MIIEVLHRFFENGNEPFRRFLDTLNIPYKYEEPLVGKTIFLLISENHEKWPAGWLLQHAYKGKTYFELERLGAPSRWNTLRALRVLKWWDRRSVTREA